MHPRSLAPVLVAVVALTACGGGDDEAAATSTTTAATVATEPPHSHPSTLAGEVPPTSAAPLIDGVVEFGEQLQTHVDGEVEYEQTPPVGGPHHPVWQTCGFYTDSFPDERGVHSIEHGAVWITYDPALGGDELAAIQALADGTREVLAGPYEGLPSPIVASAWGVQLQLESALDPRLAAFADYYENGPQTPELDVPCAFGTDETE